MIRRVCLLGVVGIGEFGGWGFRVRVWFCGLCSCFSWEGVGLGFFGVLLIFRYVNDLRLDCGFRCVRVICSLVWDLGTFRLVVWCGRDGVCGVWRSWWVLDIAWV